MVKQITIAGNTYPASLNMYAIRLIEQLSGASFSLFFQLIADKTEANRLDMSDISILLYAALKGGAKAEKKDFDIDMLEVEAMVDFREFPAIIEQVMSLMSDALPTAREAEAADNEKKSRRH